jgi:hypothetical protein
MSTDPPGESSPDAGTAADEARAFKAAFSTARIIAIAVLGTLLVSGLLVEILASPAGSFPNLSAGAPRAPWRYGAFAVAAVSVLAGRWAHKRILRKTAHDGRRAGPARLLRATAVAMAFAEIPAGLGLMLYFLGGLRRDFYSLLLVSAVLGFIYAPRRTSWDAYLRNEDGGCPF